jgi:hypothetical protein
MGVDDAMTSPIATRWLALAALMLGYALLFAWYYPPLPAIEDEVGFLNQALVWSRGAFSAEGAGLPPDLADFGLIRGRHVSSRNPGRSLVALPFLVLGGVHAVFASGLVLHLAMTAIGASLLARWDHSPLWAVLLLCHPTLALYSRTIMADAAAGTGLLLAAWAATFPTTSGALGAGLAVGLAALMRYHAGLALPIVAATIALDPQRPHSHRDTLLCLLAGGVCGVSLAGYNLVLYGTLLDPFTPQRGYFSIHEFLIPHTLFYTQALLLIWPAMLLAPVLDRSPSRWLVRGVCGFYLLAAIPYYFHDRGRSWIETLVVGQRLLQVTLPLWVVSYAAMVDDWVAAPLRRRLGARGSGVVAVWACVGLLALVGAMFEKHQDYLNHYQAWRRVLIAAVPEGSLVVDDGPLHKLFAVPVGLPSYRWRLLLFRDVPLVKPGDPELDREPRPWYLTVAPREPGAALPEAARRLIRFYHMEPVPVAVPELTVYVAHP